MSKLKDFIAVCIALLTAVACAGTSADDMAISTSLPGEKVTSTREPTKAITVAPTKKPTVERSPTAFSIETPNWKPQPGGVVTEDLLAETEGCQLPCWYGFQIGQPITDLALEKYLSPVIDNGEVTYRRYGGSSELFPGIANYSYDWQQSMEPYQEFYIFMQVDEATSKLRAMYVRSSAAYYNRQISVVRILRELGIPSNILFSWSGTGTPDLMHFWLWIVYEEGIVFHTEGDSPSYVSIEGNDNYLELCLGEEYWANHSAEHGAYWHMSIVEPFSSDLEELTPLQKKPFEHRDNPDIHIQPIQEVFDLSPLDIFQMAETDDNPCLRKDL